MVEAILPFPNIDPVLIHLWGPFALRWYALSYIAGLLLGWWLIVRDAAPERPVEERALQGQSAGNAPTISAICSFGWRWA